MKYLTEASIVDGLIYIFRKISDNEITENSSIITKKEIISISNKFNLNLSSKKIEEVHKYLKMIDIEDKEKFEKSNEWLEYKKNEIFDVTKIDRFNEEGIVTRKYIVLKFITNDGICKSVGVNPWNI